MVLPALVARHQKTSFRGGFGLKRPRIVFLLAAVLLGLSLWPLVMTMTEGWHAAYGILFGSEKQEQWHAKLIETTSEQVARIRMVSPFVILFSFSVIPALCEEWFFRGMLLRSLLKWNSVWKSILISALVFGSFHVLSNSVIALDRLLPSTLIGVMLGYLAFKSDSIWPGVILHSLNNGIVVFLAYYQPALSSFSWFPGEDESIPVLWALVGLAVATTGVLLTRFAGSSGLPEKSSNATIESGEVL
jgi:membrane protease YdiL (CAAX protease family)